MELNLKDLAGDPSDETIGAAAVGLMAQAVLNKSKIETVMASLTQIVFSQNKNAQNFVQKNRFLKLWAFLSCIANNFEEADNDITRNFIPTCRLVATVSILLDWTITKIKLTDK